MPLDFDFPLSVPFSIAGSPLCQDLLDRPEFLRVVIVIRVWQIFASRRQRLIDSEIRLNCVVKLSEAKENYG